MFSLEKLGSFSNNAFLIYRKSQNEEKIYSYGDVISLCLELIDVFVEIGMSRTRISIQCPHCPELCVILLSILNCECSFCPIAHDAREDDSVDTARQYGSEFFISNICYSNNTDSLRTIRRKSILNTTFYIYKTLNHGDKFQGGNLPNECYCIKTSGSTGNAKIVRVPYQCITPNIDGLSNLLRITSEDLIFMSSPITFDPFVVEYFLALKNGSALLITSPSIRAVPQKLAEVLQPKQKRGVSVLQMTPSLFRLFSLNNIQQTILGENTSIRILLLGGERFPSVAEISQWTVKNHYKTRIFNIYGITEVSCWCTLHEVKNLQTVNRIPIGVPIDSETQIRVVNDVNEPIHEGFGDIQIGSASRKCLIDKEVHTEIFSTDVLFRSTGDIGKISKGAIFYEGRKNEIIKRYGNRVHMGQIVKTILEIDGILNACCVYDDENMRLICFILKNKDQNRRNIQREILAKLKSHEKPNDIEFVNHFPVTPHGKISKKEMLLLYYSSKDTMPVKVFERFLVNVLCLDLDSWKSRESGVPKHRKVSLDLSFLDAGGTSFQALTLSTQIESVLRHPEQKLLEMMLNGTTAISAILEYIKKLNVNSKANTPERINNSNMKNLLKVTWQYNTGKCVDAAPRCYEDVVCVGSHSHLMVTLDSKSGREISTCILPDRIECQVTFIDHGLVLVGCYDGNLYAVDYTCGKVKWKLNCGGMIKARPLQNGTLIVIGSYSINGNLLCLDLTKKKVVWRVQIGSKGIFSAPLQIHETSLIACTLSGEIACVVFNTGRTLWEIKFQGPIFSTPAILSENTVIVAEVSGLVHCLNVNSGTELWNLQTNGNIFSSIIVHSAVDSQFIIFGNHDHNIYCLKSTQPDQKFTIHWKSSLNSAAYSTPAILHMTNDVPAVLACSTKGGIYILDLLTGATVFTMNLDNEIFSSPCVMQSRIYIGCRNNNLVCLELDKEEEINKK